MQGGGHGSVSSLGMRLLFSERMHVQRGESRSSHPHTAGKSHAGHHYRGGSRQTSQVTSIERVEKSGEIKINNASGSNKEGGEYLMAVNSGTCNERDTSSSTGTITAANQGESSAYQLYIKTQLAAYSYSRHLVGHRGN